MAFIKHVISSVVGVIALVGTLVSGETFGIAIPILGQIVPLIASPLIGFLAGMMCDEWLKENGMK